jgi:hypothetical protein
MKEITWTLSIEEASAILSVLGDLPTKTGAFPLLIKLKDQADAQVPPEQVVEE